MSPQERRDRLTADLASLQSLQQASSILEFDALGSPPDRYTLRFRGKGLVRDMSSRADVQIATLHEIELRLPYSYPNRPPDIRWISPIFHPNVSFSGFINLPDVGLPWSADVNLDVVCERLWDVARLAFIDPATATNVAAKNWYEQECQLALPVDRRPLRDRSTPTGDNTVRYQRRGRPRAPSLNQDDGDILYIGDDAALIAPAAALPPVRIARPRRGTDPDDDVLYIGYD